MSDRRERITLLLQRGSEAKDELLAAVYEELRTLAEQRMAQERVGHTLQATALVHEAWLRLGEGAAPWEGRRHFFGAAGEAMRRVLIDHARRVKAQKRGGGVESVTLGTDDIVEDVDAARALAVCEALEVLAREDARAAEVARLRFLCGLEESETAKMIGTSERTVRREWRYARARLAELLDGGV